MGKGYQCLPEGTDICEAPGGREEQTLSLTDRGERSRPPGVKPPAQGPKTKSIRVYPIRLLVCRSEGREGRTSHRPALGREQQAVNGEGRRK